MIANLIVTCRSKALLNCKLTFRLTSPSRTFHSNKMHKFGICFDVDGVVAKGPIVISAVKNAFQKLVNSDREFVVPVAFVTNSASLRKLRVDYLSKMLDVKVKECQVVQAPSPLEACTSLHNKFSLIIGQGDVHAMAKENGLENVCSVDDVTKAYPLLNMVDYMKRNVHFEEKIKNFPKIEAIVSMGEPIHWETSLQVVLDILRTNGLPDEQPIRSESQIPIYACSFDVEYKSRSHMPRLGHGAFLECLQTMYKKTTGHNITYEGLIGKPMELMFRYADYIVNQEAQKLNFQSPLETIYMIGDAPGVDIVGTNLYKRYLHRLHQYKDQGHTEQEASSLCNENIPKSRRIPLSKLFLGGASKQIESVLVCTGMHEKGDSLGGGDDHDLLGMVFEKSLEVPDNIFDTAGEAVDYILQKENFHYH